MRRNDMDFPKNIGIESSATGALRLSDEHSFGEPHARYTRDDLIPPLPPEDKSLWGVSTGRLLQELFEREVMHNVCAKQELSLTNDAALREGRVFALLETAEADAMTKLWSSIVTRGRVTIRAVETGVQQGGIEASVIVVDPAAPMEYTRFDYYDENQY